MSVFLKILGRLCISGCGWYLSFSFGHNLCLACLGCAHTQKAFVDGSCSHCENITMATLWSLLFSGKKAQPLPALRLAFRPTQEWIPTDLPLLLHFDFDVVSHNAHIISFRASDEDELSTAALESGIRVESSTLIWAHTVGWKFPGRKEPGQGATHRCTFTTWSCFAGSSALTTLDGGAAWWVHENFPGLLPTECHHLAESS